MNTKVPETVYEPDRCIPEQEPEIALRVTARISEVTVLVAHHPGGIVNENDRFLRIGLLKISAIGSIREIEALLRCTVRESREHSQQHGAHPDDDEVDQRNDWGTAVVIGSDTRAMPAGS